MYKNTVLVGSIQERKPSIAPKAPNTASASSTGFPAVQHRSKSAFARGREDLKRKKDSISRNDAPPAVATKRQEQDATPEVDWRHQMSEDNTRRVQAMTEEDRAEERKEILRRFGPGVGDILRRAKERREGHGSEQQTVQVGNESTQNQGISEEEWRGQMSAENELRVQAMSETERAEEREDILRRFGPDVEDILRRAREKRAQLALGRQPMDVDRAPPEEILAPRPTPIRIPSPTPRSPMRSALASPNPTRPSSRADRKIRFAQVMPEDVHVYESAPPSPRKKALALPPPSADDGPTVSLGAWKGTLPNAPSTSIPALETTPNDEGTPEDIRRRFFPSAPASDPSLEWMQPLAPSAPSAESNAPRFDLSGTAIPPALSATLPSDLGLHHHAEGAHAGYTLDDAFLLARSSVAAQRAAMLGLLAGVARGAAGQGEEALRTRILAAGVAAMGERGTVGARAVHVMWECLVGWDRRRTEIDGIELQAPQPRPTALAAMEVADESPAKDAINSIPLDYVLGQINDAFTTCELPRPSLLQLLGVLQRLAQHTNAIAAEIVKTPRLVGGLLPALLFIPPGVEPEPAVIRLLTTLAAAGRGNAGALLEHADALLRFVALPPDESPHGAALASKLLSETLRFYATLAAYGMYGHAVTAATEPLARVGRYVASLNVAREQAEIVIAWAGALEAWLVCARDPHCTSPPHDVLWSQVAGWGWGAEIIERCGGLGEDEGAWGVWAALWNAEAAWLEGARVNGVRGGEAERAEARARVHLGFAGGAEARVVGGAVAKLQEAFGRPFVEEDGNPLKDLAGAARVATAAMRLWLACLPTQPEAPLAAPPFVLPFDALSATCATLVAHPIWSAVQAEGASPYASALCRPLSAMLHGYLRVSRWLPATTPDLWLAQALAVLCRQVRGEEEAAERIVEDVLGLVSPGFMEAQGWQAPPVIWERGGVQVLRPLLAAAVRAAPKEELYVGALTPTTESIQLSTTQRLPAMSTSDRRMEGWGSGLPLTRDWLFAPLDHLLRSGTSEVMKTLPPSWDASETEVVRAVLLLAKVAREVLVRHSLPAFVMDRNEAVFGCMKIFMLEHGQPHDERQDEVFRDAVVGQLMEDILAPHVLAAALPTTSDADDLEAVAVRFLGPSTPFYQYYTDFVALYDGVSFSHAVFARLLFPPLSMRYAVDYRRLLWDDYAHMLRTVRTPLAQMLGGDVREYLYPVESDAQVIGAYMRALLKGQGQLEGALRFIAVHHIACNIWPDLQAPAAEAGALERAEKLLQAIAGQGDHATVMEVVRYCQERMGDVAVPPACFSLVRDVGRTRLEFVESVGGKRTRERFGGILEAA